jgi:glutaredoxin-like protein
MADVNADERVWFYWRPGCPYCVRLRRALRRTGLPITEINIWADPVAAAVVRRVADGNETVPTVIVGSTAMVNPTVRAVLAAVRREAPQILPADPPPRRRLRRWFG